MKFAVLVIVLLTAACSQSAHRPPTQGTPVLDLVKEAKEKNENAGLTSDSFLVGIASVNGVASRTPHLQRYPCARCHDRSPQALQEAALVKKGKKAAHWEVKLAHAPEGVLGCTSCHELSKEKDVNQLHSLRGEPIAFDASYKLCGQCHSRQEKDWAGGAHGKRLGGWAPPRVMQACTGCHNPHNPKLASRWPAIAAATKGASNHE